LNQSPEQGTQLGAFTVHSNELRGNNGNETANASEKKR